MPTKLTTTVSKIVSISNSLNSELIDDFYKYMKNNGASERHQNNNLKVMIAFAKFLGKDVSFYNIQKKEQIIAFLDTKIKNAKIDPDKKWITTWNHNLHRLKYFLRWLHNYKDKKEEERIEQSDWETPSFARIKEKKTRRVSPYLETELWERDEILFIVKYEPYLRNKAALTLFWDLDARNHEITLLKIKHIRLLERYGEGEIPYESKTGTGPSLLTCSFPYVRDWINKHPFKNSPDARLICNLYNGSPVRPEVMWTIMKQLRSRIIRMLENGSITDNGERQKLEHLLNTKKWNPYCIRHSSISSDSDFLPEYALKKKVRWSMNSKQGSRYIKRRMGNDLKKQILVHDGIISEQEIQRKSSVLTCARCNFVNAVDFKFCSKCSYPLIPEAYEEIKAEEDKKFQALRKEHESLRKEFEPLKAFHDRWLKKLTSILEARRT